MWLIDRDTDGSDASRIPLPAPLQQALVRWYVGHGTRHDEQAGITLVQQARIGHKWIACDCLEQGACPPILTPAFLSEADTYYLRRLTSSKRPEHRADCPFFRDQVTLRITEARSRLTPADPPSGFSRSYGRRRSGWHKHRRTTPTTIVTARRRPHAWRVSCGG